MWCHYQIHPVPGHRSWCRSAVLFHLHNSSCSLSSVLRLWICWSVWGGKYSCMSYLFRADTETELPVRSLQFQDPSVHSQSSEPYYLCVRSGMDVRLLPVLPVCSSVHSSPAGDPVHQPAVRHRLHRSLPSIWRRSCCRFPERKHNW